jgi:phosphoribosylaminoimidazole-succinocarboxamide synthase
MTRTYEGSSKNVHVGNDKTAIFEFTDRYSVFDWGAMPDLLPQKGMALAHMGATFFKLLEKKGISHHFIALVDSEGETLVDEQVSSFMKVQAVEIHRPARKENQYDYSFFQTRPTDCLIPLEVIFRWGAPAGSSLLKRYPNIKENERFSRPMIDFTTKLEVEDRFLSHDEARAIAGLNNDEFNQLILRTQDVALHLKDVLSLMHVELWDGKLEWAFSGTDRQVKLVDAIGLDELRVSFQGHALSKEFLRHHYRDSAWNTALAESKRIARHEGGDFKEICKQRFHQRPLPLPLSVRQAAETLYLCFANDLARAYTGRAPFGETLNLAHWVREFA